MRNKIIALALMALTLVTMLVGCGGNKTKCDFCGEEKKCTTKTIFGEEISICDDCTDVLYGD